MSQMLQQILAVTRVRIFKRVLPILEVLIPTNILRDDLLEYKMYVVKRYIMNLVLVKKLVMALALSPLRVDLVGDH